MCWPYFSVLSYAFDPAQLSEVRHLIKRFLPPHLPYPFPFRFLSLSFLLCHSPFFYEFKHSPLVFNLKSRSNGTVSLAPIYLIIIKMWCYYLWMRCSTTFNSLLFLRPCIFCPTLSFPGEIWGGRGSSGAFLASLVCLSLSLSLPLLFSYRLSLTQCYQYFLHESESLSLQERWRKVWFFLVKYAVIFSEIKSRRELFYFTHNLFSLFTGFAQIPWFFSISSQLFWF